jgi:hypothetical protein
MPPLRKKPVVGLERTKRKLNRLPGAIAEGAFAGLVVVAEIGVKKDSQQNTPRRLGNLANSAYVTAIENVASFAGENAGRARKQFDAAVGRNTAKAKAKTSKLRQIVGVGHGMIYSKSVHENPRAGAAGAFVGPVNPFNRRTGAKKKAPTADQVHSQVGGWKFLENAVKNWTRGDGQLNSKGRKIVQVFIKKRLASG